MHVNLNSPRDVEQDSENPKDAPENTIDVQEDAWEEHVDLVQLLNVLEKESKDAEEFAQEDAEGFTAKEWEDQENIIRKTKDND